MKAIIDYVIDYDINMKCTHTQMHKCTEYIVTFNININIMTSSSILWNKMWKCYVLFYIPFFLMCVVLKYIVTREIILSVLK